MFDRKLLRNIDWVLVVTVLLVFIIGVTIISSATNVINLSNIKSFEEIFNEINMTRQVKVQIIAFIIGIIGIIITMTIDYNGYGSIYKTIYILSILLLLIVYIPGLGVVRGGARSWIDIGPIDIQTSELAKIGFILSFAKFLETRQDNLETIKDLFEPALFVLPFILLLLKQPDLGSALVFIIIAFGMMFLSGLNMKLVFYGLIGGICSLPFVYRLLEEHQRQRIDAFLNPSDPTLPGNYHVFQSKITIGSGMLFGKGLFRGNYHRYDYLPVQETDFIFAVLGEEQGFIGGGILLFLYFIFLYRMVKIAKNAKDIYGSLIVIGITFMFAFQIIENIGMTMGIMPVTGVTLPFMSYGGSSLITSMLALGIVLNISMRRQKIRF